MSFTIIEQSVVGKYSDVSLCEDALVITPFFAAVVDGATSKCDLSFDGKTTGRLASELLSGVIRSLPYDATMSEFIDVGYLWLFIVETVFGKESFPNHNAGFLLR